MRERIKWVDTAKAIGIAAIVLGHTVGESPLKTYVYSFHIPLFFFLSGATFRVKGNPSAPLCGTRPWACWCPMPFSR